MVQSSSTTTTWTSSRQHSHVSSYYLTEPSLSGLQARLLSSQSQATGPGKQAVLSKKMNELKLIVENTNYFSYGTTKRAEELFNALKDIDIAAWRCLMLHYTFKPERTYLKLTNLLKKIRRHGYEREVIMYIYLFQAYSNLPSGHKYLAPHSFFDDFKHQNFPQLLREGDYDSINTVFFHYLSGITQHNTNTNSSEPSRAVWSTYKVLQKERITPSVEIVVLLIEQCGSEKELMALNRDLSLSSFDDVRVYEAVMIFFFAYNNLNMVLSTGKACMRNNINLTLKCYSVLLRVCARQGLCYYI